jgi:hypothetical protein
MPTIGRKRHRDLLDLLANQAPDIIAILTAATAEWWINGDEGFISNALWQSLSSAQQEKLKDLAVAAGYEWGDTGDITARADLVTLRTDVATKITRMQQIQAASNPTNAQVIQAVRDIAEAVELILKVLRFLVKRIIGASG